MIRGTPVIPPPCIKSCVLRTGLSPACVSTIPIHAQSRSSPAATHFWLCRDPPTASRNTLDCTEILQTPPHPRKAIHGRYPWM